MPAVQTPVTLHWFGAVQLPPAFVQLTDEHVPAVQAWLWKILHAGPVVAVGSHWAPGPAGRWHVAFMPGVPTQIKRPRQKPVWIVRH